MKLRDLEATFLRLVWEAADAYPNGRQTHHHIDALADADGIMFLCPKCFAENAGPIGTHLVICWFEGKVRDDAVPGPGRWTPSGTGLDDLTFVPGTQRKAVSVLLNGGCGWHGFVRNGDAA